MAGQTKTYGKEVAKDFLFADNWINLNHGSFGTYPKVIRVKLREYQDQVEARPDQFIRYDFPVLLDRSREAISQLLNVPTEEVVIVPNATTGVNTVLRNLEYKTGDVIIYTSPIYGACEKTVLYVEETTPAEGYKIEYHYPISDAALVEKFASTIKDLKSQGKNPKIAIFDTVVSMPGVRAPYEKLVELCRSEGVLSLIDAAHAIGMLSRQDLDLGKLQPDFLVSNCHKWLYVPRGCAVFYVPKRHQAMIRTTLPTSHGFVPLPKPGVPPIMNPLPASMKSSFVINFEFVGTIDNSPYLCIPDAIKFREEQLGGHDAIAAYLAKLARRGGEIVSKALGTEAMENEEGTLQNCAFTNVRLPLEPGELVKVARDNSSDLTEDKIGFFVRDWIALLNIREYDTFMQMLWYNGAWWTRLSAQTYLDEQDFEKAGEILLKVCERVKKGDFLTPHKSSSI